MRPAVQPKIFVGVLEVAGIMRSITHTLQAQGYQADLYLFETHPFGYSPVDDLNPLLTIWRQCKKALDAPTHPDVHKQLLSELERIEHQLLHDLMQQYDIFIFNGWRTIFHDFSDLPQLQAHNKKIITLLLGSEARPPWMNGRFLANPLPHILNETKQVHRRVQFLEKYSTYILSHPPASQFLTKTFLPLLTPGLPFQPPQDAPSPSWPERPVIIHAPSSEAKGTQRILQACEQLTAEGYDFEFRSLTKMPNAEVLANLAECTFVVDELYSDSLLAGLGIEAAWFGKAVVVGNLPRLEDLMLPAGVPMPPCELFKDGDPLPSMRRLLDDIPYAKALGQQAKIFIGEQWSTEKIGAWLVQLIEDSLPSEALCDPQSILYFRGWGMSDDQFYALVQSYVAKYGHEALRLQDKPILLLKLMQWLNKRKVAMTTGAGETGRIV